MNEFSEFIFKMEIDLLWGESKRAPRQAWGRRHSFNISLCLWSLFSKNHHSRGQGPKLTWNWLPYLSSVRFSNGGCLLRASHQGSSLSLNLLLFCTIQPDSLESPPLIIICLCSEPFNHESLPTE